MDRNDRDASRVLRSIPHARGDGPACAATPARASWYSPRTWGWTVNTGAQLVGFRVFPTHVGMDRASTQCVTSQACIPHARGDGPYQAVRVPASPTYSPRTWGWTEGRDALARTTWVFPTHVGMDRRHHWHLLRSTCIPHARGDGPQVPRLLLLRRKYSPRTWGWTGHRGRADPHAHVFPTHVGMDRQT